MSLISIFKDDIKDFYSDTNRIKTALSEFYKANQDIYAKNIIGASLFVILFSIFEDTLRGVSQKLCKRPCLMFQQR
jgi:hypothetical protein